MTRFLPFLGLFLSFFCSAQSSEPLWSLTTELGSGQRQILPQAYQVFELEIDSMRSRIASAANEPYAGGNTAPISIDIPLPNGEIARFAVRQTQMMEAGLADRFPTIKTFAGRRVDNPTMTVRFDLTPQGFHGMIFSADFGTVFIDPLYQGQDRLYQVYAKHDFVPPTDKVFSCHFEHERADQSNEHAAGNGLRLGDCQLRTYRLALACTGEYAQFQGGTIPLILGAMVTTMNRVNGVYEKDFATTMIIVDQNDVIIFLDAETDPYTNEDVGIMLGENQVTVDSLIGNDNYDIGHVFGTSGGGVAGYGVVCLSEAKAIGVTSGDNPVGDPFDIDYVAHEIGHQFAGSHTFRGCGNFNEMDPSANEPGSGSTIMAYAGICGDNVQSNSNDYFHGFNLEEMSNFMLLGEASTCGVQSPLENTAPVVTNNGQSFVIPASTPFFLTAEASDIDGDTLTYCWEQFDTELSTQPPLADNLGGPNFRTISPSYSPTRYFPALSALINNGPFDWEVLPSVSRDMHFKVSVRDNALGGGCTDLGNASVQVTDAAGPMVVTNPNNSDQIWASGGQEVVYWDVANTQLAPVSCTEMDILLSIDGGLSYPIVLASSVPNTGLYPVDVPLVSSDAARIMVVCSSSIFFDISNDNFSIESPIVGFTLQTEPNLVNSCGTDEQTLVINTDVFGGFTGQIDLSASNLPAGLTVSLSPTTIAAGGESLLTLSGLNAMEFGTYPILLTGTNNIQSQTASFILQVNPAVPETVYPLVPLINAYATPLNPLFIWQEIPIAETYTLQVADNPSFSPLILTTAELTENQYQTVTNLPYETTIWWRVKARNACGENAYSPAFSFTTVGQSCATLSSADLPQEISANEISTISSTITFPLGGIVTDVNIPLLQGTHVWISDIQFALTSPSGVETTFLGPICGDEDDFNIQFDDQATMAYNEIPCPPTDGGLYQPQNPFSVFNGQAQSGDWVLEVFDSFESDGGELTAWSLEVCASPVVNAGCLLSVNPFINVSDCAPCASNLTLTASNAVGQPAFIWSDGALGASRTNLCEGTYSVLIIDSASCSVNLPVVISSPVNNLTLGTVVTPALNTNNGTASAAVSGGTAPFIFLWNTGASNPILDGLAPGIYTVTVTDGNGCTATSEAIIEFILADASNMGVEKLSLMPNPTKGTFLLSIDFDQTQATIVEIYTTTGQRLQQTQLNGKKLDLAFDLSNQADGLYLVTIRTDQGMVTRKVLLVK